MKLSIHVRTNRKNKDGKYAIAVCITHDKRRYYAATDLSVKPEKVKNGKITDNELIAEIYLKYINPYKKKLESYISGDIVKFLTVSDQKSIDFLLFAKQYRNRLMKKKPNSAANFTTLINALEDFTHSEHLFTNEITYRFLTDFSIFLQSERTIQRINHSSKKTLKKGPISQQTLHNYLKDFRTLFNAARLYYNDEDNDILIVRNYPFKKFKIAPAPATTSQRALSISQLKEFIKYTVNNRCEDFAKDMFLLSFYLIGINPIDLFNISTVEIAGNRLNYKRLKTSSRRADEAFISIPIVAQAREILDKYTVKQNNRPFIFQQTYSTSDNFLRYINKGLKLIACKLNISISLTMYCARHTWATIARNDCGYSLDDVAVALNHSLANRVTDRYIKQDWSIIDRINADVLKKIF
jgi:integrase